MVDDFGIKYSGKENAWHKKQILKQHFEVLTEWSGSKYVELIINSL